jgi:4-amino-4-deoxy-L-arabinose transferase-like glycosyltransferase
MVVLTVQAVLSLRLVRSNSAYNDEALYLWAGRLEWSHWLNNTPIPSFPTYFSGVPVLYPPLAALANSLGGLAGARILSLCFMLGATVLLHGVTRRIFDRYSAAFAVALFAGLGSAQYLGAFATYDAMALFLLATATWLGVRAAACHSDAGKAGLVLLAAGALVVADASKYAATLFDPVVIIAVACFHWRTLGRRAGALAGLLIAGGAAAGLTIALAVGGKSYWAGVSTTTLSRSRGNWPVFGILFVGRCHRGLGGNRSRGRILRP